MSLPDQARRRRLMAIFSRANRAELDAVAALGDGIATSPVRGPETGMIMLRGRIGGGGSPFNLGEVTVSRASLALDSGEIGHGHVLGTDRDMARLAALADALAQRPDRAQAIDALARDIAARQAGDDAELAAETAATRVDFFTLVRGED